MLLRLCWHTPLLLYMFPFDCTGFILWTYRLSPLFQLNFFFDFTETSSPQRNDSERSPSQRRALVIETPSARQLVESKGALQSIHRWASENPQKRCTKSSKSDGSDRRIQWYFVVGKKMPKAWKNTGRSLTTDYSDFTDYYKVGSKNSVFSSLPIKNHFISVAFCLIWSLFATFGYAELKVLGYIARYAPSKTDKNPIKSIGFAELKVQKSIRHNF